MNGPISAALTAALCGALLWGSAQVAAPVRPLLADSPVGMTKNQQEKIEEIASASLFGQFRSNMADFLWMKVEKHMHSGVDLRGMTDAEKRDAKIVRATSHEGRETGNREHDGTETTVVPEKARDWRGILGDLEREVKPFQDMHDHTHRDPQDALPLFRLMTWSNPKFVNGYTIGAAMIARDRKRVDEAIAFLAEGAKANPENVQLQEAIGWMWMTKKRDFAAALPSLRRAIEIGKTKDFAAMDADERESFESAYRWLVNNYAYTGDHAQARRIAREGLRFFPDDVSCKLYLERHPR